MAGPRGVPARHPVTVKIPVVILQLMQTAEGNEAILACFFCAEEVILPAQQEWVLLQTVALPLHLTST